MINKPQIEKGIPTPTLGGIWVQTLTGMKVGDSFLVRADRLPAIYSAAKRLNVKIATRSTRQSIDGLRELRVWMINGGGV